MHTDKIAPIEKLGLCFIFAIGIGLPGIALTADVVTKAIGYYKKEVSTNSTKDAPKAQPEITPAPAP